jgi:DNA-binding response OmpR family regulator
VVADPDPLYQRYLTYLLQQEFRCIAASTLRETYQTIQSVHPALLILELNQPDGDGIGFIQHVQADPQLKTILIACVTQRASLMDKVRAFRAGTDDYLVKPVPSATFVGQMLLLRRTGYMARTISAR